MLYRILAFDMQQFNSNMTVFYTFIEESQSTVENENFTTYYQRPRSNISNYEHLTC